MLLEISKNSQENTCARVSFFNKVADLRPGTLFKTRLWKGVFLWILRNFQENLPLQNTSGGCFWIYLFFKKLLIKEIFLAKKCFVFEILTLLYFVSPTNAKVVPSLWSLLYDKEHMQQEQKLHKRKQKVMAKKNIWELKTSFDYSKQSRRFEKSV